LLKGLCTAAVEAGAVVRGEWQVPPRDTRKNSKGGFSAALLFFDLLDQLERDPSFQLVDVAHECIDVVRPRQHPPLRVLRRARLDLRVEPRVQRRVDHQRTAQAERRAVDEALLALPVRAPKVGAVRIRIAVRFPVPVGVIADQRVGEDGANVAQRVLRRHPFGDGLAPALEVIELVRAAALPHHPPEPRRAAQVGVEVLHAQIVAHRAAHLALQHRLLESRAPARCRRQDAADHGFDLVLFHTGKQKAPSTRGRRGS
jgi:hypothetical protein